MGDVLTFGDLHVGHNELGQPMLVDPTEVNETHKLDSDNSMETARHLTCCAEYTIIVSLVCLRHDTLLLWSYHVKLEDP